MIRKRKVVFEDAGRTKVAVGFVEFEDSFVKVTDDFCSSILINKSHVISIKDGDY